MDRSLLADAFDHHVWATMRLIETCAALNPEQLETTVTGTYGSIVDTLRHLVGADVAYLEVLDGEQDAFDDGRATLGDLRTRMARHQHAWDRVLEAGPDPDAPAVGYRDDGSEGHAPTGVRLAQALHVGSGHRSQICTTLTSVGFRPPDSDVGSRAESLGRSRDVPPHE